MLVNQNIHSKFMSVGFIVQFWMCRLFYGRRRVDVLRRGHHDGGHSRVSAVRCMWYLVPLWDEQLWCEPSTRGSSCALLFYEAMCTPQSILVKGWDAGLRTGLWRLWVCVVRFSDLASRRRLCGSTMWVQMTSLRQSPPRLYPYQSAQDVARANQLSLKTTILTNIIF